MKTLHHLKRHWQSFMKTAIYLFLIAMLTFMPYVFVSATLGEWNVMGMPPRQQGIIGIGGGILLLIACAMTVVDIWEKGAKND